MGSIRTLLATSVLITHSGTIFGVRLLSGDMAVTCFYILSGFLITLILKEKYEDRGAFYVNRLLRIFPPYLAALVLSLAVFSVVRNPSHSPFDSFQQALDAKSYLWIAWSAVSNLTLIGIDLTRYIGISPDDLSLHVPIFMHEGLSGGHQMLLVPQGWTLALELQFYLLAPLLVRMRLVWLALVTQALLLTRTFVFESIREAGHPVDDAAFFPMQLHYFLLGMIAYYGYAELRDWQIRESTKRALSVGMCFLALIMIFKGLDLLRPEDRRTYDLFYVAFAATVPFQFWLTKSWRWDRLAGEYSYPIYVFHFVVNILWMEVMGERFHGEGVLVATLVVATLYIRLVDDRVQRIRSRIADRPREPGRKPATLTMA